MGILNRNRSFLVATALIIVIGAVLFGSVMVVRVLASGGAATPTPATAPISYNSVSSWGLTGYQPLAITTTPETPSFIAKRLKEKRGMVLLVYCEGASDDEEMVQSFESVKALYAGDDSFFDFEARESKDLGDVLQQLRVNNPPILAIIQGNGQVFELYTGWVDEETLEQRLADAVRGI